MNTANFNFLVLSDQATTITRGTEYQGRYELKVKCTVSLVVTNKLTNPDQGQYAPRVKCMSLIGTRSIEIRTQNVDSAPIAPSLIIIERSVTVVRYNNEQ